MSDLKRDSKFVSGSLPAACRQLPAKGGNLPVTAGKLLASAGSLLPAAGGLPARGPPPKGMAWRDASIYNL